MSDEEMVYQPGDVIGIDSDDEVYKTLSKSIFAARRGLSACTHALHTSEDDLYQWLWQKYPELKNYHTSVKHDSAEGGPCVVILYRKLNLTNSL